MCRKVFKNVICFTIIGLVFFSCKKDKPDLPNTTLPKDSTKQVLIVCEGSLGNGNAELSVYNPISDSVFNSVFQNANKQSLGDVFQSIAKINNQYFLCINNSDKIVVLNAKTWLQEASINVSKPRYLLDVGNHKSYVGSLFSNKIYVINTNTFTVEKEIKMPYQNVEGMLLKDGFVYACCWDTACNKLYQINTANDIVVDSIVLSTRAPQSIVIDKENHLWVMGGNAYKGKVSSLSKINLSSKKLIQSLLFADGVEAIKPVLNKSLDTLYFIEVNYNGGAINNGIFRFPLNNASLPVSPFISCQPNQYFWALGSDSRTGNIYVGDPKGFVQKSSVLIYNSQAQLKTQFNVGLGVGAFYFD
jgi:hypothetical protein